MHQALLSPKTSNTAQSLFHCPQKQIGSTHRISLNAHTPRLHILHQPGPPAPLYARQSRVELLLERVQTTIARINRPRQLSTRRRSTALALRRQILPEKGVVDVTATVEVDERLERNLRGDVLRDLRGLQLL